MIDARDIKIAKMNALAHIVNLALHNNKTDKVELKDIVDEAEKLLAWILNPNLKYVKPGVKETKG